MTKVAIITGASRGIGAALIETYRAMGYRVVANSRGIAPCAGPDVLAVPGDIAHIDTAERIVRETISRFGRIDSLVNNAGIFIPKPFTDYTPEDFGLVVGTNVGGFFHLTQRVVAQMLDQGHGGHIVSLTTALVEQPDARIPAALTALSKGGVAAVTKALAIEYAGSGIRVNAISPGVIDTPMHAGTDVHAAYAHMHPQNRVGTIADIAHGVRYLEQSPFVTGEVLHIDGGQNAGH
ncbi:oxidoreductase [Mycobacterium saskatchewanense]|uniref:3-oxoacyl-ACP reductase n=1 Tax=Mycobacterium saskatchewanense TaxID=220927 RepID=A0AAJ3TU17_9MYCO|nr:SDR family oxidoreductase [Mycobacterium saskatchewanense]ORW69543.1 3-oxoacyl-ACP reductase [Mycobacterium saskatchewanense]BBX60972.1 oxidoreductase [Mycobacterium saskatchewanense]